jgi:acetyl esterase/lipase
MPRNYQAEAAWARVSPAKCGEAPFLVNSQHGRPIIGWLRDLQFVPGGHERQKLDLYLLEKASGPLPVIVRVHGGGWKDGSKDWRRAEPLVPKGYAVASVNYRPALKTLGSPHGEDDPP